MRTLLRSLVCLNCLFVIPCFSQDYVDPAFSIHIREGTSLTEVLAEIHQRFGIDFAYPSQSFEDYGVNRGQISGSNLVDFLDFLFSSHDIAYKIIGDKEVLLRFAGEESNHIPSSVSGRVVDLPSGQPIPDVAVLLDTLMIGTYTDAEGAFYLDIPPGLPGRKIQFRMLGYKTEFVTITHLAEFPEVGLKTDLGEIPEILVAYKLPVIKLSETQLSMSMDKNKLSLVSASDLAGSDLFRKIQLLPGIAAYDDLSSEIRIRGSEGSETLILLDGIPIYRADHFYGIFSSIDEQYIEKVEVYKNALPVQYGGRTGGMVSMQSGSGPEGFHGALDLNLLTTSLQLKGALTEKVQFILNGRTTYDNAANSKFFDWIDGNSDFYLDESQMNLSRNPLIRTQPNLRFYDINSKLIFSPDARQKLDLNFYRSRDDLTNEYENLFSNRLGGRQVSLEESFSHIENWDNTGVSLNYDFQINGTWDLQSSFHYSQFDFEGDLISMLVERDPLSTRVTGFTNQQLNRVEDLGIMMELQNRQPGNNPFSIGMGTNKYSNQYGLTIDENDILSGDRSAWEHYMFGQYDLGHQGKWNVSFGARASYYSVTNDVYVSPIITSSLDLSSKIALKASYSRPHQFIREISHEDRLGRSMNLLIISDERRFPVSDAHNFMTGLKFETGPWTIDIEFYNKKISNVIEYALVFPGFLDNMTSPSMSREYLILNGSGHTIGMDLLVHFNKGPYSGWMAYTLSNSTNRFRAIQRNESFPSLDDRRHQLKWISTLNLGAFELSLNYIYASGKPYTDLTRLDQGRDRRNLGVSERINRLPSYHRMDAGVSYPFRIGPLKASAGLSVFNLTDNRNVKFLQYIFSINTDRPGQTLPRNWVIGNETSLIDRTFNLDFKVEF